MSDMPRRPVVKPIVLTVGGLALAASLLRLALPGAVAVETRVLVRAPFEETLRADGRIDAREKYNVNAFADGDLRGVNLRVGDPVSKGDPVAHIVWDYDKVLRSPADGVVSRLYRDNAGPIQRGTPILEIAGTRRWDVVGEFLTSDAVRLRPGQSLRVEGWGGKEPLLGRVTNVSRAGYTKVSALGVEEERTDVRGEFVSPDPGILARLGHNYHVEVTVVVSTESAGLAVPLGALLRDGEGWAVYRVVGGRAQLSAVRLDRRNERDVLVVDGLREGDQVILYPGDHITSGLRVKPQEGRNR